VISVVPRTHLSIPLDDRGKRDTIKQRGGGKRGDPVNPLNNLVGSVGCVAAEVSNGGGSKNICFQN